DQVFLLLHGLARGPIVIGLPNQSGRISCGENQTEKREGKHCEPPYSQAPLEKKKQKHPLRLFCAPRMTDKSTGDSSAQTTRCQQHLLGPRKRAASEARRSNWIALLMDAGRYGESVQRLTGASLQPGNDKIRE